MKEDEMVRRHHRLNGHESEQALGDGENTEAKRAAVHGVVKSDTTERPNNNFRQPLCLLTVLLLWNGSGHHVLYNVTNLRNTVVLQSLFTRSNSLYLSVTSTT